MDQDQKQDQISYFSWFLSALLELYFSHTRLHKQNVCPPGPCNKQFDLLAVCPGFSPSSRPREDTSHFCVCAAALTLHVCPLDSRARTGVAACLLGNRLTNNALRDRRTRRLGSVSPGFLCPSLHFSSSFGRTSQCCPHPRVVHW